MKNTYSRAKAQRRKGRRKAFSNSLRSALRLCAFAGVILSFFALCVLGQTPDDRGLGELKRGLYPTALQLLNARLEANPNDIAAQRGVLRVYSETGRY
jgi:hypothetical protein